jgi:hypothetical protein
VVELNDVLLLLWSGLVFWVLGQIWLVQMVVYPLFAKVGEAEYIAYHRFYTSRIPLPVINPGFARFFCRPPWRISGRPFLPGCTWRTLPQASPVCW